MKVTPKYTTVRFTSRRRLELKTLAAQRGITMEAAMEAAFDLWKESDGKVKKTSFVQRVIVFAARIEAAGSARKSEALLCVLEALAM